MLNGLRKERSVLILVGANIRLIPRQQRSLESFRNLQTSLTPRVLSTLVRIPKYLLSCLTSSCPVLRLTKTIFPVLVQLVHSLSYRFIYFSWALPAP